MPIEKQEYRVYLRPNDGEAIVMMEIMAKDELDCLDAVYDKYPDADIEDMFPSSIPTRFD